MAAAYFLTFSFLGVFVVFLIWLRLKPGRADQFSETALGRLTRLFDVLAPTNPIRGLALQGFIYGGLAYLLACYVRVYDPVRHVHTFVRLDRPYPELLLVSQYILVCAAVFLIVPLRIGQLLLSIGFAFLGLLTVYAGLAGMAGAKLRSMHGDAFDLLSNEAPWLVVLMGGFTIYWACRSSWDYFREGAESKRFSAWARQRIAEVCNDDSH